MSNPPPSKKRSSGYYKGNVPIVKAYTTHARSTTSAHSARSGGGKASKSGKARQRPAHAPSNTIMGAQVNSVQLDKTKRDLRDLVWGHSKLFDNREYRRKVWMYAARQFHTPDRQAKRLQLDNYTNCKLSDAPDEESKSKVQEAVQGWSEGEVITENRLELYLQRHETYVHLIASGNNGLCLVERQIVPTMRKVLAAYAISNGNRFPLVAAIQLCAVLQVTTTSEESSFRMMHILSDIMKPFRDNDEKLIKDGALLVIDELARSDEEFRRTLNHLDVDVVDLSLFVVSWVRGMFAHHFYLEFVQRVVDLVLVEGPSVLLALAYGVLWLLREDIKTADSKEKVFDLFDYVKEHLKQKKFIDAVITQAEMIFSQDDYRFVTNKSREKSWHSMLTLPGKHLFRVRTDVGHKSKMEHEFKKWKRESRFNLAQVGDLDDSEESGSDMDQSHAENVRLKRMVSDLEGRLAAFEFKSEVAETSHANVEELREKHSRAKTLGDVLFVSPASEINVEPIGDRFPIREVQCRTEDWQGNWKRALESVQEKSVISMDGYLIKMTASRFNTRGVLDKMQKRWFMLRGCYLTYMRSVSDSRPKGDRCLNIAGFKVNAAVHAKNKYALEMISPPSASKKRVRSMTDGDNTESLEHIKFVLMPEMQSDEERMRRVRDNWILALRFGAKGGNLWNQMLGMVASSGNPGVSSRIGKRSARHTHHGSSPHSETHDYGYRRNNRTMHQSGPSLVDASKGINARIKRSEERDYY